MMDWLFPNFKRRFKIEIIKDFAADKQTWIGTLQQTYSQVEEVPEMLYKHPKRCGNKVGARIQQKRLSVMPKISKSAKACLQKQKAAKPIK